MKCGSPDGPSKFFRPFLPFTGAFKREKVDLRGEKDKIIATEFDSNYSNKKCGLVMAKNHQNKTAHQTSINNQVVSDGLTTHLFTYIFKRAKMALINQGVL